MKKKTIICSILLAFVMILGMAPAVYAGTSKSYHCFAYHEDGKKPGYTQYYFDNLGGKGISFNFLAKGSGGALTAAQKKIALNHLKIQYKIVKVSRITGKESGTLVNWTVWDRSKKLSVKGNGITYKSRIYIRTSWNGDWIKLTDYLQAARYAGYQLSW